MAESSTVSFFLACPAEFDCASLFRRAGCRARCIEATQQSKISIGSALPPATTMLAGQEYLGRPVSWACSLRPSPPAFPKLDGDELALIDMDDLRRLDPKMRLERVVRGLKDAHVAAVAVQGDFGDTSVKAAQASDIALFALPGGVPLNQIERSVIRLIVDRSGYLAQRSSELQRELNQIALDGGGLSEIANHLAAFTLAPAAIVSEDGRTIAHAVNEGADVASVETALTALPNIFELRSWAAAQGAPRRSGAIGILPLRVGSGVHLPYRQIVVSPIIATDSVRGYCLLLRTSQSFDWDLSAVEEIAVTEGASASALEWAKQYAVDVAEERMRAAFVDELLASEIADEAAWVQRGASLGYDLATPHAAWLIEAREVSSWPQPAVDFLDKMQVSAPYSKRHTDLLVFWPIRQCSKRTRTEGDRGEYVRTGSCQASVS